MPGPAQRVDASQLAKLRKLMPEAALGKVFDTYFRDGDSRMQQLRNALEAGDVSEVESIAHAMKGSSGMLGMARTAELCGQIENAAEAGDLASARASLPDLQREWQELRPVIANLIPLDSQ